MTDANEIPELTGPQQRAILALLGGATRAAVAAAADVDECTVYRWLRRPDFKAELRRASQVAREEIARGMVARGQKALAAIDICTAGQGDMVILRAACFVLAQITGIQTAADLEAEVGELRALLESRNAFESVESTGGSSPAQSTGPQPGNRPGESDALATGERPELADEGGGPRA